MDKPIIFTEGSYDDKKIKKFMRDHAIWRFKDVYGSQLTELFQTAHPAIRGTDREQKELAKFFAKRSHPKPSVRGNYVYFPWSGVLLHMVDEADLTVLRTNRTRDLITVGEQGILQKFTAGVAGLSFGNGIALALAYSGIAHSMKLADKDIFETTNLNRVRVGLSSVGELKTDVTAREIYEINPYADLHIYPQGLHDKNITHFVGDKPKLKILFDVVDNFAMKVRIRLAARSAKIPVVMLTSLEDSVLVDVERYDVDKKPEIFHGMLGDKIRELLTKDMTERDKARYAMMIVGPEHVSYRNMKSLSHIGDTLVSRPHLYGTVSIVCGIAAYIAKRIALHEDMPSVRQLVRFHDVIGAAPNHDDTPEARSAMLSKLAHRLK